MLDNELSDESAAIVPTDYPPTPHLRAVATRLRERPADGIAHTLATLTHWRTQNHSMPHRLDEWKRLLRAAQRDADDPHNGSEGLDALLHALESDDDANARLRDFHPFHGLFTREKRRVIRGTSGYKH